MQPSPSIENPTPLLEEFIGSENLLVSFGGIGIQFGIPPLEFTNITKNLTCDKIFIRDLNQAWYQNGISPELDTIEKITDRLQATIKKYGYKKVVFLGNSMGGYAAILFGTLLNVDSVYAFSPQTFIDQENRTLHKDNRWNTFIAKLDVHTKNTYQDLARVLENSSLQPGHKTQIHLYSGQNPLDIIHIRHLEKFSNVHPVEYPDSAHNIVKQMRDTGELRKLLLEIF